MLRVPQSHLNLLVLVVVVVVVLVIYLLNRLPTEVSCYRQTLKIHNRNKEIEKLSL
jgi:hypothetical protein